MKFNKKINKLLSVLCLIAVLFSAVTLTGCDSQSGSGDVTGTTVGTSGEAQLNETTATAGDLTTVETKEDNQEFIDVSAENPEDAPVKVPEKAPGSLSDKTSEKTKEYQIIGDDNSKVVLSEIPEYKGKPYVVVNDNIPSFNKFEVTTDGYETYSALDESGRCRGAIASCGIEIMPEDKEERKSISSIKPSGWVQAQYPFVSGRYLYNRCHLIGWQLSAENANNRNLITGTRYMNTEGMLPFENMVADYIKETQNHVAYRVTPIYEGNDLVARGVQMEAYSVEDNGEGICFNVFCYNIQPGVIIDYATGNSSSNDINAKNK